MENVTLEQCHGDTVEALIFLEKENKISSSKTQTSAYGTSLCDGAKSIIKKLNATRFVLRKEEKNFIDIPLSIALIAIIFCCHISIVALIIAYCCGYRIRILSENEIADKINKGMDFVKQQI